MQAKHKHPNGQGTQEDKLTNWINAYNGVTVKGILNVYPISLIFNGDFS